MLPNSCNDRVRRLLLEKVNFLHCFVSVTNLRGNEWLLDFLKSLLMRFEIALGKAPVGL